MTHTGDRVGHALPALLVRLAQGQWLRIADVRRSEAVSCALWPFRSTQALRGRRRQTCQTRATSKKSPESLR